MVGTLGDAGPTTEDWRHLVLSIRDRLLPPLTKISNQPTHTFARCFTGEHFGLDLIVFITCENTHAVLLVQALFNTESRQG